MEKRDFARKVYDPRGSQYDDSHHPLLARFFVEYAGIRNGDNVLDLACGTGLVTFYAAEAVGPKARVVGLDVSEGMLNEARTKKEMAGTLPNVTFYNHDITDLDSLEADDVRGQEFDVITVCSALVLLDDPVGSARKWLKYLKPGGRLVVDAVTPKSLPAALAMELTAKKLDVPIGYNTSWSRSENDLRRVLTDAGYQVSEVIFKTLENTRAREYKVEDAAHIFGQQCKLPVMEYLAKPDVIDEARKVFKEVFRGLAVGGIVEERPSIWIAKAVKPRE